MLMGRPVAFVALVIVVAGGCDRPSPRTSDFALVKEPGSSEISIVLSKCAGAPSEVALYRFNEPSSVLWKVRSRGSAATGSIASSGSTLVIGRAGEGYVSVTDLTGPLPDARLTLSINSGQASVNFVPTEVPDASSGNVLVSPSNLLKSIASRAEFENSVATACAR